MANQSGFNRDVTTRVSGKKASPFQALALAAERSGRSTFEVAREFWQLHRGPGRIALGEYLSYGLYDSERLSMDEKSRFLSEGIHWAIARKCCDMSWLATTEDKWLAAVLLGQAGIPVPGTVAVIDRSPRTYAGAEKISTAEQLKAFLQTEGQLPLFGKQLRGIGSLGAFLVTGATDDKVQLKNDTPLTYAALIDDFVGDHAYLLQQVVRNDPFFDQFTPNTATVRLVNLISGKGVITPFAALKLPSERNIADNFWRRNNLLCEIDVATGEIRTAVSKGAGGIEPHADHPETGSRLAGARLPHWPEVLEISRRAALLFAPVRFQSLDVAITADGPVVVEINTGCAFDLLQFSSGRGFLTDEVREVFRSCGCPGL